MEEQKKQSINYLYGYTSPETAYVVEDYPWGFRLRTTIRYWVESKNAKNGGQRFAHQTINPKTGSWCAIKYSTYSPIIIMFLDENNHVKYTNLSTYDKEDNILKFKETHLEKLDDFQKEQLKLVMAINNVMKHVEVTIKPNSVGMVNLFSQKPEDIEKRKLMIEDCERREKEKKEEFKKINRAIAYEYNNIGL